MGIKKVVSVFLIGVLLCGLCSCDTAKNDKIQMATLKYLNEYYDTGDTFSVTDCHVQKISDEICKAYVTCHSEKYDGDFTVNLNINGAEADAEDDYYKVYMMPEAGAWLNSIFQKCGADCIVRCEFVSDISPNTVKPSAMFGEYVASGKCKLRIYVFSDAELSKKNVSKALSIIASKKVSGEITLYLGDNVAELLDNMSVGDIIKNKYVARDGDYTINNAYDIITE